MPRFHTLYATIAQSASVSGNISVRGADLFGVWCPTVTSCALYVQGAFSDPPSTAPTSANFVRLTSPDGAADWTWAVGPGSKAVTLQDLAFPWPYLRLETSVAQANVRSFAVVCKFR